MMHIHVQVGNTSFSFSDVETLIRRLEEIQSRLKLSQCLFRLELRNIDAADETLVQVIVDLLRSVRMTKTATLMMPADTDTILLPDLRTDTSSAFALFNCLPNPFMEYLLETVMGMDLFDELEIDGTWDQEVLEEQYRQLLIQRQRADIEEEANEIADEADDDADTVQVPIFALDALGFRLKFARQLRHLQLCKLLMTRDHMESLMYGMEANSKVGCHLTEFVMEGIIFVDNLDETVQELCEGFSNNKTLEIISIKQCRLTDRHMSLLFNALTSHPTLSKLQLFSNNCQHEALKALDQMLRCTSLENVKDMTHCQLRHLELSHQNRSDMPYSLDLSLLWSEPASKNCVYSYPCLEFLDLSGNHLEDSHMEPLAKLVLHRFYHLKYLILSYNNVTTDGLGQFASCLAKEFGKNSTTMFPRLRELLLLNNPLSDKACRVFLDLLNILPQLKCIRSNIHWEKTKLADAIQHMMELNWAGRVLLLKPSQEKDLSTCHTIGLAVWPAVLARLAKRTKSISMTPFASPLATPPQLEPRSANGIFHLLRHGPIFMHKNLGTNRQCQPKASAAASTLSIEDSNRKRKRDPALGGFCSLEEFLNHEATLRK